MPEISDNDLISIVNDWSSDERRRRAASQRMAKTIHKQLALEESRFSGLLLDLVERKSRATITLKNGKNLTGTLESLGRDFVGIKSEIGNSKLISIYGITAISVDKSPRSLGEPSNRSIPIDTLSLMDVMAELAVDQVKVRFGLDGSTEIKSGILFGTGDDLIIIGLGEPTAQTLFVSGRSILEISLT